MGRILAENILSNTATSDLKAGDIAIGMVDLILVQDITGTLAVRQLETTGFKRLANPGKPLVFQDHDTSNPSQELSNDQLVLESYACSGEIVVDNEFEVDLADYIWKYGDFEVRSK